MIRTLYAEQKKIILPQLTMVINFQTLLLQKDIYWFKVLIFDSTFNKISHSLQYEITGNIKKGELVYNWKSISAKIIGFYIMLCMFLLETHTIFFSDHCIEHLNLIFRTNIALFSFLVLAHSSTFLTFNYWEYPWHSVQCYVHVIMVVLGHLCVSISV